MTDARPVAPDEEHMLLQVERPKKLAENVAARLLNYITAQNLEPGAPLPPQSWLVENLHVGRASLREALRFLEMHGFIELRSGRNGGPIVGDLSSKNFARMSTMYFHALGVTVREVMDARIVLEPAMVRAIAEKGLDPAEHEQLVRFGTAGCVSSSASPPSGLTSAHDFHWSIAELSGNGVLKLIAESTREVYAGAAREVVQSPKEFAKTVRTHAAIADAILAGDGAAAQQLMSKHVHDVLVTLERSYPHVLSARIAWP